MLKPLNEESHIIVFGDDALTMRIIDELNDAEVSVVRLASAAGLQAASLCLLNYGLRGLRWRFWMAQHGRHFGLWQGLRLYLAGYAFTPTPGNVGEAVRGLMLAHQPLGARQSLAIFGAERLADLL